MRIKLTGGMRRFDWGFDHRPYSIEQRRPIRQDERVRLALINTTDMWHPVHLHGHTFALSGIDACGARQDTAYVLTAPQDSSSTSTPTIRACGCSTATTSTTPNPG